MFIGHLPAGYLLTRGLAAGRAIAPRARNGLMALGLVCAVLPDLDLLWFYLVDGRRTVHHAYLFHVPVFWAALAALLWALGGALRWRHSGLIAGVVLANLLLHMALDSIAAEIGWLRPFSDLEINLVRVPALYDWWVWNFVLHWTFGLEIALCAAALVVWLRARKRQGAQARG